MSRKISGGAEVPLTMGKTFTERLPGAEKRTYAQLKEHIEAEAGAIMLAVPVLLGLMGIRWQFWIRNLGLEVLRG